jgi:hypothetical protein
MFLGVSTKKADERKIIFCFESNRSPTMTKSLYLHQVSR